MKGLQCKAVIKTQVCGKTAGDEGGEQASHPAMAFAGTGLPSMEGSNTYQNCKAHALGPGIPLMDIDGDLFNIRAWEIIYV